MCEYPNRADPEYPFIVSARPAFGFELSHRLHRSFLQNRQLPQAMVKGMTTRSPTFRLRTLLPRATTSPMNSWPRMSPAFMVGMYPSYRCRSDPQMAVVVTRMT